MGLFDWFKNGKTRFTRFDDAYALTRPALWQSLRQTVQSPLNTGKSIWLVVHFTDTFSDLQTEMDSWQVDYDIVTKPIDPSQLEGSGLLTTAKINVVLAGLIPKTEREILLEPNPNRTVAMIMVERHPQIKYDDQVESFARALPARVEFGYYLSLDDDVVRLVINDTSIKILKQLGMNEHELIASSMVTRRLNKMLRKVAETYRSDNPADSARLWLEINQAKEEELP